MAQRSVCEDAQALNPKAEGLPGGQWIAFKDPHISSAMHFPVGRRKAHSRND